MNKFLEYAKHVGLDQYGLDWVTNTLGAEAKKRELKTEEVEHIIDFLASTSVPKRISKMSYVQAKASAEKWLKTQIKKGSAIKELPSDTETILDFKDGFRVVRLVGENAYKREGFLMRHCVADYYGRNVEVYSLRDANNMPHCTMEKDKQIKGKGNGDIHPRYIDYIVKFLGFTGMKVGDSEMAHLGYVNIEKIAKDINTDKIKKYLYAGKYLPKTRRNEIKNKDGSKKIDLDMLDLFPLIEETETSIKIAWDIPLLAKTSVEFIKGKISSVKQKKKIESEAIQAGEDSSQLAGADSSKLAGGNYSQLSGGDDSQLAGGDDSQLAGGDSSQLAGGDDSQLAGGDDSQLAGRDYSQLAGGNYSQLAGGVSSQLAGGCYSKLSGGYASKLSGGDSSKLVGGDFSKLAGGVSSLLAGGVYSKLAGGVYSQLAGGNSSQLAGGDYSQLAGGASSQLAGADSSKLAGGNSSKLAGGDSSKLAGGVYSQLAGGGFSQLAGGNSSKLAGGVYSQLAGGDSSQLAGGDSSQLAGGNYSQLAGGDSSQLAGGCYSKLAGGVSSKLEVGKYGIAVGDHNSTARGKIGSLIVLIERSEKRNKEGFYEIKHYKAGVIDGKTLKEDIFYTLVNGEFVRV